MLLTNKFILKTDLECKLYILYKYYISNNKLRPASFFWWHTGVIP